MHNILPSLLDRFLKEDIHGQAFDSLKDSVRRDLQSLLNARTLDSLEKHVSDYDEVVTSTVNFGTKDYSGVTNGKISMADVADMVYQAILNFEPRIIPETLQVVPSSSSGDPTQGVTQLSKDELKNIMEKGSFDFIVRGAICSDPTPLEFQYKTALNVAEGDFTLT